LAHEQPNHIISGIYAAVSGFPDLLQQSFSQLIAHPNPSVQEALKKFYKSSGQEATIIERR
ncbi:MAG: hypothetical protein ABL958_07430, partial [Bdellovibrionia bacterium]